MKRYRLVAIALALALFAPGDAAANIPETALNRSSDSWASGQTPPLLLSGVACNASAAARTWTMTSERGTGYATGIFQLDFTQTAATAITMQVKGSLNSRSSWATMPACDATTDGTCTLTGNSEFDRALSASENVIFRVDFNGAPDVQIILTCTGGGASDTFNLYGRMTTK